MYILTLYNKTTNDSIIMSLTPILSSDKDIRGVPSMQSSYSAEMKQYGICMEMRSVHCTHATTL